MPAPVAGFIQLPLDTGNTGKKVRSQTRVVGADTVHEHYFVRVSPRSSLGIYKASSGVVTVPIAANNGTTTGWVWLINPIGSGRIMGVRRIAIQNQFAALAVDLVPGDLRTQLFTFTGTASGTAVTVAKADSAMAAASGSLRLAMTGLTITLGGVAQSDFLQTMDLATGGAGHWNPMLSDWEPDEESGEIILRPGEGLVVYNALALTTANRRAIVNVSWEEYE